MADKSKIEWTDASWNPIRARNVQTGKIGWHCQKVSPGCEHCYAESMNRRLGTRLSYLPEGEYELFLDEKMLTQPLRWTKPRRVFVCSMTDLFANFVPDEWIDRIFATMADAKQHTFQILTKRPKRMRDHIESTGDNWGSHGCFWEVPLPNVWLGVSAEDQQRLDERAHYLFETPAAMRWLSIEPMLGPMDLWEPELGERGFRSQKPSIDWCVVGGESGPGARPMHPNWARSIRDQCVGAGVPFFFKQWGEWAPNCLCDSKAPHKTIDRPDGGGVMFRCGKKAAGREIDGRVWDEMPDRCGVGSGVA